MHFKDMEYHNFESILRAIEFELVSPTRSQIAQHLSISNTTVSQVTAKLIQMQIIRESGSLPSNKRGRPGIRLEIDPRHWVVIGAAFTSRRFLFVAVNLLGEVLHAFTLRPDDLMLETCLDTLAKGMKEMVGKFRGRVLPAVGLSMPGLVNPDTGVIIDIDGFDWRDVDLSSFVQESIGLPVMVVNRNWASAVAEYQLARMENSLRNFLYVGVGTDIGSAIIINGELVKGENFAAGKLGHVVVDPNGPLCSCGRRGCLQTVAAQQGLISHATTLLQAADDQCEDVFVRTYKQGGTPIDLDSIDEMLKQNSPIALAAIRYISEILAQEIGNMIKIFDPEKVVIGGHLPIKFPVILNIITELLQATGSFQPPRQRLNLELATLSEQGSAIGAALFVLEKKLTLLPNSF